MSWFKPSALAIGTLLALSGAASANPITTLYSTGVDAFGNVLADGSADPHYQLTSVPSGASSIITTDAGSANPFWPKAPGNSAYISPIGGPINDPVGVYLYTTTFNLTGFNSTSAQISGQVSGDDAVGISLNGAAYFATSAKWTTLAAFALTSGFVNGLNTLTFAVYNSGGATGLDVSMSGSATATAVPEPGTLSILGAGCVALSVAGWRRRAKRAVL